MKDTAGGIGLPMGVQHRVGAPKPTALILGSVDADLARASLERLGCQPVPVPPGEALDLATELGTISFVLLGADVMTDEESVFLVQDLHAFSPGAKVLLLGTASDLTPKVLVHAIRAGVSDVVDPTDVIALSTTIERSMQGANARAECVLAIGAHPDDVEIGCAGTLLEHRRRGDSVSVMTMSHGDVGGDQEARILESSVAAQIVGARLMLADLPDTRIDAGVDTIRMIESVVQSVDPTIIYVHSKSDYHQDHRAVHAAVISASRRVPQIFAYQSPSATNDFAPTRFVAIDQVVIRKVEVLGLFASQSERSYLEPEMIIAGARYWARNLAPRAKYAEPFEVIRRLTPPSGLSPGKPADAAQPVAPVVALRGSKVGV